MEHRKSPSKKKFVQNNQEEKVSSKKRLLPDSVILQNKTNQQPFQGVYFTVSPRSPAIKTLFLAEKSRFSLTKASEKNRSLLAIGDHPSFNFTETFVGNSKPSIKQNITDKIIDKWFDDQQIETPSGKPNNDKAILESAEKCYVHAHRHKKNHLSLKRSFNKEALKNTIRNLLDVDYSNNNTLSTNIIQLNDRVDTLKSIVRRQEMVLGEFDFPNSLSSSDEGSRDNMTSRSTEPARPGSSYIEHYSHVPETSAFQRYAQQSSSLSPNKGATIEKEHNSEQYGRDFTAYDGLTARGRRQCTSVTSKRDDVPRAAERMIKIRHKLNPVRDYRLMDTVHYLAQGEFAPRNDGIKLTPSREAVLSDIIWEDVCRTHWPTARLGRRHTQERNSTRNELQRLIDSLLRERIAHVERRRRRHYRIVKHTQHSAGRVGKTGDIIVASHKHKHRDENDVPAGHIHHASGLMMCSNRWPDHRSHMSDDRLMLLERRQVVEECTPGPSYAAPRSRREPTCCYHAAGPSKPPERSRNTNEYDKERYSSSSTASSEKRRKNPRLVVKKDPSRKKYNEKELNLEHFILLPTLVVRTPSNVKRQKKFNELYHRILNQISTEQSSETENQQNNITHRNCQKNSETSTENGNKK